MHRFIAPSASPKTIATPIGWSSIRGRHSATRIDRGERQAAERRARRAELVEDLDRERRPHLRGDGGEEDEADGAVQSALRYRSSVSGAPFHTRSLTWPSGRQPAAS